MEISIRVEKDRTPELMQKLDAAIGRFVRKGAAYIEGDLKRRMTGPKSGRVYKRGKRIHIASAPGESPAVDSGNLIGSIQQVFPSTLEAKVGTNANSRGYPYPLRLENPAGLNRPLWEVTARESLPTLEEMLREEIAGVR